MCGLAAAISTNDNAPFLTTALTRLEYRGYDSFGFTLRGPSPNAQEHKWLGAPSSQCLTNYSGQVGVAHTRWASHGQVSYKNTHPIDGGSLDSGLLSVVHNGIVENHLELRQILSTNYLFRTETDTESLAHLLADKLQWAGEGGWGVLDALREVLEGAAGRYSAVAMYKSAEVVNSLFLISKGMPLYVHEATGLVASDPVCFSGFVAETESLLVLRDQVGWLTCVDGQVELQVEPGRIPAETVAVPPLSLIKGDRTPGSRMRGEINEQPGLFLKKAEWLPSIWSGHLMMLGSGSSYHAALLGTNIFAAFGQSAFATLPSQFPLLRERSWNYLAITQSGETADVLRVLDRIGHGYVLTNRANSTAALRCGYPTLMGCGDELAVAATKSFTATCLRLLEIAVYRAGLTGLDYSRLAVDAYCTLDMDIERLVRYALSSYRIFVAGNGEYYPVALEGALKLKECAYRHAEGVCLSEIKHGPLALLDKDCLVIASVLTAADLSNLAEILARGICVFVLTNVATAGSIPADVPFMVLPELPVTAYTFNGEARSTNVMSPLSHLFIYQRLAYKLAILSGIDPDMPRNIAKSLTV